ncbi:hypothetical protein N5D83_20845 [Pseudomonas chengduensis]|nr:hypothetical protein [Pseudomonas chengduensis]MDH1869233.1 hypothetical protein [Pseudomonas chengduensis]
MDDPHQASNIRCTVCAPRCNEEHRGTLQGNSPSDEDGKSEHYLVNLCQGCFLSALRYLRQEHEIMNLFDYEPSAEETFGLVIEHKK